MRYRRIKKTIGILMILSLITLIMITTSSCNFFEIVTMPPGYISTTDKSDSNGSLTPGKGGNLTVAATDYDNLDPLTTQNYYMEEILGLIYDGLFTLDSSMQAVPALAEKYESSADGITWKIKLKENVLWHDGKYFSAEDVEYTMELLMGQNQNKYYYCVENIESVTPEGAYTVKIKCKTPDSFLVDKLIFAILPKHAAESSSPVGTGLYKFGSISGSESEKIMTLISCADNTENMGRTEPYISSLTVKFYKSEEQIKHSDCDIVMLKYDDYPKVEGKIGYSSKKYLGTEYEILAVNTTKDILSNSAVRRAIAYGIDRDGAVKNISSSRAIINDLPVFPETWIRPLSKFNFTHDESKAKELMTKSGHNDLNLTLLVNADNIERIQYAEYYKETLKQIGIEIEIVKETAEVINEKISQKDYDLALLGINIGAIYQLSSFYGTNSQNNITGYSNANLDDLFGKLNGYTLINGRKQVYSEIEEILLTDVPFIGLYFKQNFILYNTSRVYGISESKPNYIRKFSGIEKWYLAEEIKPDDI